MYGRRAKTIVISAVTLAAVLALPAAAAAVPTDPRLAAVKDWGFAIGSGGLDGDLGRYADYDMLIVDGQEATTEQVAALRAGGKKIVLAYLSVGTIEKYRPWYKRLKRYRLPDEFEEFDEPYARLNAQGFRNQIARRIAPEILAKGFDGLFLDNTDMVETHRGQRKGLRKLVVALSALVDSAPGRYLFSQNGGPVIGPLLPFYDGWNREDPLFTYNFDKRRYQRVSAADAAAARAEAARISAAGLLTLATDYTAGDQASTDEAVANACASGSLPFVADIALRRLPFPPLHC